MPLKLLAYSEDVMGLITAFVNVDQWPHTDKILHLVLHNNTTYVLVQVEQKPVCQLTPARWCVVNGPADLAFRAEQKRLEDESITGVVQRIVRQGKSDLGKYSNNDCHKCMKYVPYRWSWGYKDSYFVKLTETGSTIIHRYSIDRLDFESGRISVRC